MGRFNEDTVIRIGIKKSGQDSSEWDYAIPMYLYNNIISGESLKELIDTLDSLKERITYRQSILLKEKENNEKEE